MSLLRRTLAGFAFATALLVGGSARAEEPVAESARSHPWTLSVRGGYGTVFTAGVSYLHAGFGASVARSFGDRWRVELVGLASSGESVRAGNESIGYRSTYSSVRGSLGMSYELRPGPLRIRPGIAGGVMGIDGHTRIGPTVVRDEHWFPIVGPTLETVVRVGRFEVGLAAEAFFVPSWPAAPSAGVYAIAGLAL